MSEGKTKESEEHNNSLNLALKQYIVDTVTLKHSKYLMHVKRAYVLLFWGIGNVRY